MEKIIVISNSLDSGRYPKDDVQSQSTSRQVWRNQIRSHNWRPPTDVYETEDAVCVRIEIAGMKDEDFAISVSNRSLLIRGIRLDIQEKRAYHQMEIFFGEFAIEVELPCNIITDQATAEYQSGLLKLILPKEKPHKIDIKDI
jgi:HSP20 family protein